MPIITVIVPVFKVEPYLNRCVDSIMAQTFQDFELILVDDGSPDNCGAICDEYAARESRIHVIHQKNGGISAARNTGIDWAFANIDSQWLTFIDSDDWVHPEYLEMLYQAAIHDNTKVSICGFCRVTEMIIRQLTDADREIKIYSPEEFWCSNYVNATIACGKLYMKEVFQNHRYPVGKLHEDEFVTYQILFAENRLAVLNAPLYYYFQNDSGIMRSKWSLAHLSGLDAYGMQIKFFSQNKFQKAYQFSLRCYMSWSKNRLKQLETQKNNIEAMQGQKIIRKKLRRLLCWYHRDLPLRKNREEYEIAFPQFFRFYHFVGGLLGRHR